MASSPPIALPLDSWEKRVPLARKPRVAVVAHRFRGAGGIQTCFIELIIGLNQMGIIPEIVWDEPPNWDVLRQAGTEAAFTERRLPLPSGTERRLPRWLWVRLSLARLRIAQLDLGSFDFVYSFEPGVIMADGVPNVCWLVGPPYLKMPGDEVRWRYSYRRGEMRKILHAITTLPIRPDEKSRYVTHSEWIADLCFDAYGFRPPVIWPPVRSRKFPAKGHSARAGFLFLSRLQQYKRAEEALALAAAFPDQRITIAGAVVDPHREYVDFLRAKVIREQLQNVTILENPSEDTVADLLTTHEFFLFAAHWEHFGIVTVEAIFAGMLPLVHNSGGQREIVPFEELRFNGAGELIEKARILMSMPNGRRVEILSELSRHAMRGRVESYRSTMLSYLKDDLHLNLHSGNDGDRQYIL